MAVAKNIKLELVFEGGVVTNLVGDSQKLRQLLANIVGNAIKFTDEGFVCLRVFGEEIAGVAEITFEVSDTGVGIPEESLDLVFESFVQADNTASRKYSGTGLGLAISKQIVDLMGGKISVRSEVGKGTVFTVVANFDIVDSK